MLSDNGVGYATAGQEFGPFRNLNNGSSTTLSMDLQYWVLREIMQMQQLFLQMKRIQHLDERTKTF
jgi:hypothetical protein